MSSDERDRELCRAAFYALHLKQQGQPFEWIVSDVVKRYPVARPQLERLLGPRVELVRERIRRGNT
jgi:hypothetical protein